MREGEEIKTERDVRPTERHVQRKTGEMMVKKKEERENKGLSQ